MNKELMGNAMQAIRFADCRLHQIWTVGLIIVSLSFMMIGTGILLHSLWGWGIMALGFAGLIGLAWCREEFVIREGQLSMKWKTVERMIDSLDNHPCSE